MWTMLDTDLVRKHGGLEPKTVKYRWTIHTHKRKFVFPTKNYSNDDIEQINITWTHDQNGSIYIGVLNGYTRAKVYDALIFNISAYFY
jgi:hypothetical protein